MTDKVNPAFEEATRRLTPVVLDILKRECPWALIPDEKAARGQKMFEDGKLYSTKELAKKLGLSEKTLHNRFYNAKKNGSDSVFEGLVSRRLGRERVYEGRDLNAWWDSIRETVGDDQNEQ